MVVLFFFPQRQTRSTLPSQSCPSLQTRRRLRPCSSPHLSSRPNPLPNRRTRTTLSRKQTRRPRLHPRSPRTLRSSSPRSTQGSPLSRRRHVRSALVLALALARTRMRMRMLRGARRSLRSSCGLGMGAVGGGSGLSIGWSRSRIIAFMRSRTVRDSVGPFTLRQSLVRPSSALWPLSPGLALCVC